MPKCISSIRSSSSSSRSFRYKPPKSKKHRATKHKKFQKLNPQVRTRSRGINLDTALGSLALITTLATLVHGETNRGSIYGENTPQTFGGNVANSNQVTNHTGSSAAISSTQNHSLPLMEQTFANWSGSAPSQNSKPPTGSQKRAMKRRANELKLLERNSTRINGNATSEFITASPEAVPPQSPQETPSVPVPSHPEATNTTSSPTTGKATSVKITGAPRETFPPSSSTNQTPISTNTPAPTSAGSTNIGGGGRANSTTIGQNKTHTAPTPSGPSSPSAGSTNIDGGGNGASTTKIGVPVDFGCEFRNQTVTINDSDHPFSLVNGTFFFSFNGINHTASNFTLDEETGTIQFRVAND
ncbi:MAG: hypothetical protein HRT71_13575, partial [Flavobacteriales bacterium]|nr:hypothetical protein [Flavobacteriales bacterium]